MKILSSMDLNKNEPKNLSLEVITELPDPSESKAGEIRAYGTNMVFFNGSEWVELADTALASPSTISYTLLADSWSDNIYTIESDLIAETAMVYIDMDPYITADEYTALATAKIVCSEQGAGYITLKALGSVPEIDIPITITLP